MDRSDVAFDSRPAQPLIEIGALRPRAEIDATDAERELEQCLALSPTDTEARAFLDALLDNSHSAHGSQERIKTNFEENSFQQLVLGIQSAAEERLAKTDPASHALFHVGRGQELLTQGFLTEAEKEFREAVALDANNPELASKSLKSSLNKNRNPKILDQGEISLTSLSGTLITRNRGNCASLGQTK